MSSVADIMQLAGIIPGIWKSKIRASTWDFEPDDDERGFMMVAETIDGKYIIQLDGSLYTSMFNTTARHSLKVVSAIEEPMHTCDGFKQREVLFEFRSSDIDMRVTAQELFDKFCEWKDSLGSDDGS